jgi:hypothetical protein
LGENEKWSKLSEMTRTFIKKLGEGVKRGGEFRVLACADTGVRTPLGVQQYFIVPLTALMKAEYLPASGLSTTNNLEWNPRTCLASISGTIRIAPLCNKSKTSF